MRLFGKDFDFREEGGYAMNRLAAWALCGLALVGTSSFAANLPPEVAEQVAKFKDPNPKVRQQALTALGKMGEKAKPAIPEIVEMASDKQTWVMTRALMVLPDIGPDETVIKPMVPFLGRDKDIKDMAVLVFAKIGDKAVPALVDALKDEKLTEGACNALGAIGPPAKSAVSAISAAGQKAKNKNVKDAATDALRAINK